MNRNIKSTLLLKSRQDNHRNSAAPIKRYTDRQERHDARQQLRTGKWMEEDQYEGEAPPAAFGADLVGESMPQNPSFGVRMEVLL